MITKLFMLIWCQECYLNNPPSFFKLKLTEISFQLIWKYLGSLKFEFFLILVVYKNITFTTKSKLLYTLLITILKLLHSFSLSTRLWQGNYIMFMCNLRVNQGGWRDLMPPPSIRPCVHVHRMYSLGFRAVTK